MEIVQKFVIIKYHYQYQSDELSNITQKNNKKRCIYIS